LLEKEGLKARYAPPAIRELEKMHAEGKIEIYKADVTQGNPCHLSSFLRLLT
jgi:hypothetical protein